MYMEYQVIFTDYDYVGGGSKNKLIPSVRGYMKVVKNKDLSIAFSYSR